ncbi:MAG TPA: bifunctional DNA primase/polymerase, partial [Elusimicrobiales bacterium]|nr:bifunctional DNA primase/polymerase [Elusimicrobiales bacterium]
MSSDTELAQPQNIKNPVTQYRDVGLRVIRLCSSKSVHRHGGKPCDGNSRGKVPLERNWQELVDQVCDDRAQAALEKHTGNFGLPIPPDLIVIDADTNKDYAGIRDALRAAGLKFWEQKTGRGGHFILRQSVPGTIRNSVHRHCDGLTYDIRGVGGQIVVFPSVHFSRAQYKWVIAPWDIPRAELSVIPEKFLVSPEPATPPATTPPNVSKSLTQGERNDALFRLGCSMRAKGFNEAAILAALIEHNTTHCSPALSPSEIKEIAKSSASYNASAGPDGKPPSKKATVDIAKELSALQEKWPAATEEKARDALLTEFIGKLLLCPVLESERVLDDLQKLTGYTRQILKKVLVERAQEDKTKTLASLELPQRHFQITKFSIPIVDYVINRDEVNKLYDALLVPMLSRKVFYNYHGSLVHIRPGQGLTPITEKNLPGIISSMVEIAFQVFSRKDGYLFKGFGVLPPNLAAAFINSARILSKFPFLEQYTRAPVFDGNWNLIAKPGFHETSKIYYDGPAVEPVRVTTRIKSVLDGFSWKSVTDMVNYLGMLLTGFTMPHWPGKHPMTAYNGNKPGVGKSTAARIVGIILEGKVPVTLTFNPNDEEFEKHLATRVGAGDRVVNIDNAKKTSHVREVESPVLERSITDPILNYRRLGANQAISRINDVIFNLTMNYTKLSRDLRRRSIPINLFVDENVREVHYPISDLEGYVLEHRLELLAELAGMVLRRIETGKLELEKPATHSVGQKWAETIDGILRCSGFNG